MYSSWLSGWEHWLEVQWLILIQCSWLRAEPCIQWLPPFQRTLIILRCSGYGLSFFWWIWQERTGWKGWKSQSFLSLLLTPYTYIYIYNIYIVINKPQTDTEEVQFAICHSISEIHLFGACYIYIYIFITLYIINITMKTMYIYI